jgi:formate hydrogenlyase subunit 3/multisubunit Na+/H+ antiporter MnhD subunit
MFSNEIIFLIPVVAVGLAAAIHATAYIHGEARRHLPRFWAFFAFTIVSMVAVVFAKEKLSFLLAWEAMGLASAGLVAFESKEKSVKKATWIYLLACHAGGCAVMLSFASLNSQAWIAAFAFAVVGFGLKIGFPPFHAWLPEAHPAAPAPASAIMSAAMIPLGFLGLLRFFPLPNGWEALNANMVGWTFLAFGVVSSIGGILFSLPQANLKRLLAFSSVENMGVVAMGFGLSALAVGRDGGGSLAALCSAGALAHIINHAFLKGSLFLAAGSILRQTGTLDQDKLGGLLRRMPFTGTLFAINALGLAGLPPLNGFLGELAIYLGAFLAIKTGDPILVAAGFLVAVSLSITGGLAIASYAKAIGAAFLGFPRSAAAANAVETPRRMWLAQLFLTCLSVAMIPGTVFFIYTSSNGYQSQMLIASAVLCALFAVMVLALLIIRRFVCPRASKKIFSPVWDCGYEEPSSRMAYTATAFTQPLVDFFRPLLQTRRHVRSFKGDPANPSDAAIVTETSDIAISGFWRPIFTKFARIFQLAHLLQNGSLHLYILIILIAVLALLVFALLS